MKKHFVFLLSALVGFASVTVAQTAGVQTDSQKKKGIHPYNVAENAKHYVSQEDANWSLLLHGGFNVFDGDFNAGREAKHSVFAPSVGLGAEYKFNPTWGLGVDYTFRQVGVTGNTEGDKAQQNLPNLLRGFQHEASAYLTLDLFNLFIPRSKTKLFALNLIAGGSFMAYRNTNQTPVARTTKVDGIKVNVPNFWKNKTATPDYQQAYPDGSASRVMDKYDYVGGFFGGASFDFNVSRSIALGIRALYHFYGNDKIDGRPDVGANNDGVFDTELLLRCKFEAQKKSHVNNYVSKEVLANTGRGVKASQVQRDTVVLYYRDTTAAGIAIRQGDTTLNVYNATYITNPESERANYYYVYFENDKYSLSDEALVIIQQVSDRMKENPDLRAAIIGYCDNVGSVAYNKRLGQNRSQKVLEELQLEYGLDVNRMFAIGKGVVVGKRSSAQYAPNRRVEIRLVNTKVFDDLKFQYRDDIDAQKEFLKTREAAK